MQLPRLIKIFRSVRDRPAFFYALVRQTCLFLITKALWPLFGSRGVTLARNVRVQRLRCLMTDGQPEASISIGKNSIIYERAKIEAYGLGKVLLGEDCVVGDTTIVSRAQITIGNRLLASWNVFIQDFDPHPVAPEVRAIQVKNITGGMWPRFCADKFSADPLDWSFPSAPISIGDDVWVGAGVTILKGVTIGSGSVVAAGSIVTRGKYPARSLIAGNPASVVKAL